MTVGKGYYSYDLGGWHIGVLNSNDNHCAYVSCAAGSDQANWLQNDLAIHPAKCTLAYMHHPLYATGTGGLEPRVEPLRQSLYNNGADVMLNGHDHRYERLAKIDPNDNPDPNYGIRPIIAGRLSKETEQRTGRLRTQQLIQLTRSSGQRTRLTAPIRQVPQRATKE